ncbi:hypothetical protein CDD81_6228 [Ophiocordyceps australis]|uniref:ATP-dependent Clp protease proteolytic subunit n=1 Tax=Ophiocordyceps australis TaxID=1399860 RepID=A0A2C5Y3A7_9HYPO|nr:hypothetical protein CDD81_6228 [Ophiocordyceps australis]
MRPPSIRLAAITSRSRCLPSVGTLLHRRSFASFKPEPISGIPMPYIEETTPNGRRTWDIFSKLLQERIICLNGTVDDVMSASIVAQLLWLESDTPDKPITMYINSGGGSVSSGLAIYDTMNYIKSPVSTICVGRAASMAAVLLAGGEPGMRFALQHSYIMIHQPLGGTQGQVSEILIYANQIQRVRAMFDKILQHHLNKAKGFEKYSLTDIANMMERDNYLNVQEAIECGVIDSVLTRREDNKAAQSKQGDAAPNSPSNA